MKVKNDVARCCCGEEDTVWICVCDFNFVVTLPIGGTGTYITPAGLDCAKCPDGSDTRIQMTVVRLSRTRWDVTMVAIDCDLQCECDDVPDIMHYYRSFLDLNLEEQNAGGIQNFTTNTYEILNWDVDQSAWAGTDYYATCHQPNSTTLLFRIYEFGVPGYTEIQDETGCPCRPVFTWTNAPLNQYTGLAQMLVEEAQPDRFVSGFGTNGYLCPCDPCETGSPWRKCSIINSGTASESWSMSQRWLEVINQQNVYHPAWIGGEIADRGVQLFPDLPVDADTSTRALCIGQCNGVMRGLVQLENMVTGGSTFYWFESTWDPCAGGIQSATVTADREDGFAGGPAQLTCTITIEEGYPTL